MTTPRTYCTGSGEVVRNGGFPVLMDSQKAASTIRVTWCAGCQHRVLVMDGQIIDHYSPQRVDVDRQPEQSALAPKGRTLRQQLGERGWG